MWWGSGRAGSGGQQAKWGVTKAGSLSAHNPPPPNGAAPHRTDSDTPVSLCIHWLLLRGNTQRRRRRSSCFVRFGGCCCSCRCCCTNFYKGLEGASPPGKTRFSGIWQVRGKIELTHMGYFAQGDFIRQFQSFQSHMQFSGKCLRHKCVLP